MSRTGFPPIAASLAALLVAAGLAAPSAGAPSGARVLRVAVGSDSVLATVGTRCSQQPEADGTAAASCTEARYPLRTRGRLTLRPNRRVRMTFGATPSSVKWRLLRSATADAPSVLSGRAHRDPDRRRRFVFRLPRRVPCGAVLDVFAIFRQGHQRGDADYWAAVRVPGC